MKERTISGRAAFYLQHQKRIEEWAKLNKDVNREAHDFYCSLLHPLDEALQELPGEPELFAHLETNEPPKLFLFRREWGLRTGKHPRVGIGVEWPHKRPTFNNAYSGVWLNARGSSKEVAQRLRSGIVANLAELPTYRLDADSRWWPVWMGVKPHQELFWEDLDGYAEAITQEVCDLWERAWETVHKVLTEALALDNNINKP